MNPRTKFIAGGVLIAAAVVYLIYSGTSSTMVYYLTTSEVVEKIPAIYNQRIRLNGKVEPGSLNWNGRSTQVEFNLTDEKNKIRVVYQGVVPDGLRTIGVVIAEGRLLPAGYFQADNLLIQCPSKYEPEKVELVQDNVRVSQ